jgi:signal transduction histidine kinase
MPAADNSPDRMVSNAADQLRHDLNTPLTAIAAHASLLARSLRRSSSLSDGERGRMLDGVAAIEEAVRALVVTIDGMKGTDSS